MFGRFLRDRPGRVFLVGLFAGGLAGGWAYQHRRSLPFGLGGVCTSIQVSMALSNLLLGFSFGYHGHFFFGRMQTLTDPVLYRYVTIVTGCPSVLLACPGFSSRPCVDIRCN
jgi:hypothetical protein